MIKLRFILVFLLIIGIVYTKISDSRLCANEDCTKPISTAKTLLGYPSPERGLLSFPANIEITIYSKSAGSRLDLWGAEINGKRGYVPVHLIKESRVFVGKPSFLRPTELAESSPVIPASDSNTPKDTIVPNSVVLPYEVIDGTTIRTSNTDEMTVDYTPPPAIQQVGTTEEVTPDPESILKNVGSQDSTEQVYEAVGGGSEEDDNDMEEGDEEYEDDEPDDDNDESDLDNSAQSTPEPVAQEPSKYTLLPNNPNDVLPTESRVAKNETLDPETIPSSTTNAAESVSVPDPTQSDAAAVIEQPDQVPSVLLNSAVSAEPVDNSKVPNLHTSTTEANSVFTTPDTIHPEIPPLPDVGVVESFTENPASSAKLDDSHILNMNDDNLPNTNIITDSVPNTNTVDASNVNIESTEAIANAETVTEHINTETETENVNTEQVVTEIINTEELTEKVNAEVDTEKVNTEAVTENVSSDVVFENVSTEAVINRDVTETRNEPNVTMDEVIGNIVNIEDVTESGANTETITNPNVNHDDLTESNTNTIPTPESVPEVVEPSSSTEVADEPGWFSSIYTSLFSSADETQPPQDSSDEQQQTQDSELRQAQDTELQPEVLAPKIDEAHATPDLTQETTSSSIEQSNEMKSENQYSSFWQYHSQERPVDKYLPPGDDPMRNTDMDSCESSELSSCLPKETNIEPTTLYGLQLPPDSPYRIFFCLFLSAVTVLAFIFGSYYIEKKRFDRKLFGIINELEKRLQLKDKEVQLLKNELDAMEETDDAKSTACTNAIILQLITEVDTLKEERKELIANLTSVEQELENVTETGIELNDMLRRVLSSKSENDRLTVEVDTLHNKLTEQQETLTEMSNKLTVKTEEHDILKAGFTLANEKINEQQIELDKILANLVTVQDEKSDMEVEHANKLDWLTKQHQLSIDSIIAEFDKLKEEHARVTKELEETTIHLNSKCSEFRALEELMQDHESGTTLVDLSIKTAEVEKLTKDNLKILRKLKYEIDAKEAFKRDTQIMVQEIEILKVKCVSEEKLRIKAEQDKIEAESRLLVLTNYFKEKESQLQKAVSDLESKWVVKDGESESTVNQVKFLQDELSQIKAQNDLYKKEILDQEVCYRSKLSIMEKEKQETWLSARQMERKFEEARQELCVLRNRLLNAEKCKKTKAEDPSLQNRSLMSSLDSNGEISLLPLNLLNDSDTPPREHGTASPPLSSILPPPPFMAHGLPPPPPLPGMAPHAMPPHGMPFMPPMSGMPAFMPPPPAMFPGDHRPPPLGRMSSPPLRYSPNSLYDQHNSPTFSSNYSDGEHRRSRKPPQNRTMQDDRRYNADNGSTPSPAERAYLDFKESRNRAQRRGSGLSSRNSSTSMDNNDRHKRV